MSDGIISGDRTNVLLDRMLELNFKRQGVISHNMANANTPGYIRKDVKFLEELKKTLQMGDLDDLSQLRTTTVEDLEHAPRSDGNNVNISRELNTMMQNGLEYKLANRILSTRIKLLKSAISK